MQGVALEIRNLNLEKSTTNEEVSAKIQTAAGENYTFVSESVKSLRVEVARRVIGDLGEIRVGLLNWSIREVSKKSLECFKCWH